MTKLFSFISLALCLLPSCYYDVEQELYGTSSSSNCDSIKGVYNLEIKPLIENQCQSCHNNGFMQGGINLEGYENTKSVTLNGKLLQSIKHETGISPMPQGAPKLNNCDILKVSMWKNQGAPNN